MSLYVRYPLAGVPTYATSANLPALAGDGALAVTLDDDILHVFNLGTLTWLTMSGPTSVLAVGTIDSQTASTNGAVIASNQIVMQSASATKPGLVNNTTQSFSGNKTFTGTIAASNLSGTNTGDVTLAAFGSTPSANAASLAGQVLTLQPADSTHPGGMSTGTQTIAGAKTFSTSVTSPFFQSTTSAPASAGQIRLANTDLIEWRNAGDSGNFTLSPNLTGFSPNSNDILISFPSAGAKLTLQDTSFDGEINAAGRLTVRGGGGGIIMPSGDVIYIQATSELRLSGTQISLQNGAVFNSTANFPNLTASQALVLDSSKNAVSMGYAVLNTASTLASRDGNGNSLFTNVVESIASTATAAGTTTLTSASEHYQEFTGTSTQTVVLPAANSFGSVTGVSYEILNRSTGAVTVKDGGSNTLQVMAAGSQALFVVTATGSAAGTWDISYTTNAAANAITALTGDVTATGPGSVAATIANLAVTNAKIANSTIDLTAKVTGVLPNGNTTATSTNTNSAIVARDGSGNFSAGTISAALTGAASGNTTYTPNNHGVVLSGAANAMTVIAPNASTVFPLVSGGASANPTWAALTVPGGGTGVTSATAYAVLCGGTTSTGALQSVSGVGTSGQLLTSNGASALPTWQDAPAASFPAMASYTPTLTGFGTASSVNCRYVTWGNLTFVQFSFVSGTSTGTEARMSLPNSLTSKNDYPATQQCGNFCYDANSAPQGIMLIEASVGYFTFGLQSASSGGSSKQLGSTIVGAGNRVTGWAWVQTS